MGRYDDGEENEIAIVARLGSATGENIVNQAVTGLKKMKVTYPKQKANRTPGRNQSIITPKMKMINNPVLTGRGD